MSTQDAAGVLDEALDALYDGLDSVAEALGAFKESNPWLHTDSRWSKRLCSLPILFLIGTCLSLSALRHTCTDFL